MNESGRNLTWLGALVVTNPGLARSEILYALANCCDATRLRKSVPGYCHGGNTTHAAERLGVQRRVVARAIVVLGLADELEVLWPGRSRGGNRVKKKDRAGP